MISISFSMGQSGSIPNKAHHRLIWPSTVLRLRIAVYGNLGCLDVGGCPKECPTGLGIQTAYLCKPFHEYLLSISCIASTTVLWLMILFGTMLKIVGVRPSMCWLRIHLFPE
jgi:hypothetical protein